VRAREVFVRRARERSSVKTRVSTRRRVPRRDGSRPRSMADVTYPLIQGGEAEAAARRVFLLLTVHDYKVKMNMI
jgi:hypothetical protein